MKTETTVCLPHRDVANFSSRSSKMKYYGIKKGELSRVPLSNHTILNQLAYLKTVVLFIILRLLHLDQQLSANPDSDKLQKFPSLSYHHLQSGGMHFVEVETNSEPV